MLLDWQEILVGITVLAACAYLAHKSWRVWSSGRHSRCGGCHDCGGGQEPKPHEFVPLDDLKGTRVERAPFARERGKVREL